MKKKILFNYLNRICGDKLIWVEEESSYAPNGDVSNIMYEINYSTLYFDGGWFDNWIAPGFNIEKNEFQYLLKEWFEETHKMTVKTVI